MSDGEYSPVQSDAYASDASDVDPTIFPNSPRRVRSPTPKSPPHVAATHKGRPRKGKSPAAQGVKKKAGRPPGKYGKYNAKTAKQRKDVRFFLPHELQANARNTRACVMPKRIYARTKRVYQSSPKNLFYDNNLMFRPSILTPTILRAMAELRSKHNKVTDLFNKRFPSMVSSIGSNRSSINTLFLQNRVIGVESLDFLRGWFHKCAVKMPGYPVNVDRNEVPRFDDVISLAMGATQFGVDTISDDQEPCPKLTLQDLQLLILHDFNIGTAMRQINQIRSSESRYQLRYLSDAELDLADKTLHVHAPFQSVAHLICWWRYVCRAIPHVLFCGNTEHMRDNTFMAFLAANINERPTALWLESQARITTVNRM